MRGQVTEENSSLLFYSDAEMKVRICNGCIEIKIKYWLIFNSWFGYDLEI